MCSGRGREERSLPPSAYNFILRNQRNQTLKVFGHSPTHHYPSEAYQVTFFFLRGLRPRTPAVPYASSTCSITQWYIGPQIHHHPSFSSLCACPNEGPAQFGPAWSIGTTTWPTKAAEWSFAAVPAPNRQSRAIWLRNARAKSREVHFSAREADPEVAPQCREARSAAGP